MSITLKNFAESFTYETTAPVTVILPEINQIGSIAKINEEKREHFKMITISSFIFYCLSLLCIAMHFPTAEIVIFILIATTAGVCGGFMWNRYASLDFLILRHRLLKKVLEMLARDLAENDLTVKAALSKTYNKPVRTIPHPYFRKVKIEFYTENWLNIEGDFVDETHFSLTANELTQKISGWRRASSGKNKYKSKLKLRGMEVSLTLTHLKQKYCAVETLQERVQDAVKIPNRTEIKQLKVTDKTMNLIIKMPYHMSDKPEMVYKAINMMFLSFYQVINWIQTSSKQQVGEPLLSAPSTMTDVVKSTGRRS